MPFLLPGRGGGSGGSASGGGLNLLFTDSLVENRSRGLHAINSTVIRVRDATGFRAGRPINIRGELYSDVESVDLTANTITLPATGLTVAKSNNSIIRQSPILGIGDTLQLPITTIGELEISFGYDLYLIGANAFPDPRNVGSSYGNFYESDVHKAAWYRTPSYSGLQDAVGATYTIGLIHSFSTNLNANSWTLDLNPLTGELVLFELGTRFDRIPSITELVVAGRVSTV